MGFGMAVGSRVIAIGHESTFTYFHAPSLRPDEVDSTRMSACASHWPASPGFLSDSINPYVQSRDEHLLR